MIASSVLPRRPVELAEGSGHCVSGPAAVVSPRFVADESGDVAVVRALRAEAAELIILKRARLPHRGGVSWRA